MREIKYRAWDKKEKKMGFDINVLSSSKAFMGWQGDNGQGAYVNPKDKNFELMQYTGLKDKNGKEIYEGDIFRLNKEIYKVNFRSGCFMADNIKNGNQFTHSKEDVKVWHTLMESQMKIEVIGNIYENKEVLNEN